jgi:hypothetical protein
MEKTSSRSPFRPQFIELVQVLLGESGIVHYNYVLVLLGIGGFSGIERAGPNPRSVTTVTVLKPLEMSRDTWRPLSRPQKTF